MARKITLKTNLKRGDIVRLWGKTVIGLVVKHEKFLGHPGFYAFNKIPGDKKFIKEVGVDWYTRHHINDMVRDKAEIITLNELIQIDKKNPSSELKILIKMKKRSKAHSKTERE